MVGYIFIVIVTSMSCTLSYTKDITPTEFIQAEMAVLQNIAYALKDIKKTYTYDAYDNVVTKEIIVGQQRSLRAKIRKIVSEGFKDNDELAIVLRKLYFALGAQKSKIIKLDIIDQAHLIYLYKLLWLTDGIVNQLDKNIYDNQIISDKIIYLIEKAVADIVSDPID